MNGPPSSEAPAAAPRVRRRFLLLIVPLALIAAVVGAYLWSEYQADRELRQVIAELDASDPGWRLEELEAARKEIPDEENSALIVLTARGKMPKPWPGPPAATIPAAAFAVDPGSPPVSVVASWYDRLNDLPPEVQLDAAPVRDMRAELARAGTALDDMRRFRTITTHGRYPLTIAPDFASTQLPSAEARGAAELLEWDALLLGQDRDADGALASARGILAVARSIGDEPFLSAQIRRMMFQQIASRTVERVLAQGRPSAPALKATQELFEDETAQPVMLIAARAYRAELHASCEAVKDRRVKLSVLADHRRQDLDVAVIDAKGPTLARQSQPFLLRQGTECVEVAKLPPEQQGKRFSDIDLAARLKRADGDIVVHAVSVPITQESDAHLRGQAALRCAIVALALERYRIANNHWPEKLTDLAPDYLKAVPSDPFDGQPLRYKRLADGVLVYSVSRDGKDDGGALNRKVIGAKGTDLGFRLWDVERRRQPPAEVLPPPDEGVDGPDDPKP